MSILADVKQEKCFYCADGSVLHNLYELEKKLRTISPEAFSHHVSQSKNDFHNWIRDVFQDYALANEILKAKTPAAAAVIVRNHVREALLAEQEIESAIKVALMQTLGKGTHSTRPRTASAPAAAKKGKKRKSLQQRQGKSRNVKIVRKKSKNRKLNKMTFLRRMSIKPKSRALDWAPSPQRSGKLIHGSRKSKSSITVKRGKSNSSRTFLAKKVHQKPNGKREAMATAGVVKKHIKKHIKKHLGQWLKWLSVNPKV